MKSVTKNQQGSAILGVLIVALLIIGLAGTYLRTAYSDYRYSRELMMGFQALNLAESGIEHAILALNENDWSDWDLEDTGNYTRTFSPSTNRNIRVVADASTRPVVIFSEGFVESSSTPDIGRQIEVELDKRGLFANGLTARHAVVFNGNRMVVDSYRSSEGPYDILTRRDRGTVASNSIETGIVQIDNADIWGFVATGGGEPEIGPQGSIAGEDTDSGEDIDPARISYDFYSNFPDVIRPDTTGARTFFSSNEIGIAGTSTTYRLSDLNIGNNTTVTVYGDVTLIVDGVTDIKGELQVDSNSTLKMYVENDVTIGGTGIVNSSNKPAALQIYGLGVGNDPIKLHGSASLYATVYAPNSPVSLKGGGSGGAAYGAIVGDSIDLNGNYDFHYDEDVADLGDSGYTILIWRELYQAADRKNFAVLQENGL